MKETGAKRKRGKEKGKGGRDSGGEQALACYGSQRGANDRNKIERIDDSNGRVRRTLRRSCWLRPLAPTMRLAEHQLSIEPTIYTRHARTTVYTRTYTHAHARPRSWPVGVRVWPRVCMYVPRVLRVYVHVGVIYTCIYIDRSIAGHGSIRARATHPRLLARSLEALR